MSPDEDKAPLVAPGDVQAAEGLFETWIGFDFGGAAPRRLRDFLVSRAARNGYSRVADYLADLPDTRPDTAEAQRLVNIVTNGLTAFWRDDSQIEALGAILGDLATKRDEPLAVWCAGCATGEEAYTVAMLAAERELDVRVLGTDINTNFLDSARRAQFDDWSLRRLTPQRRERWFERRDQAWALDASVAARVEFRQHNLLDQPPQAPTSSGAWDVILCRNVVIYLTPEATAAILVRFGSSLALHGYLLLGSSEQIMSPAAPFRVTRQGPAFVFRPVKLAPGNTIPFPAFELPEVADVTPSLDEETINFSERDAVRQLLKSGLEHVERDAVESAVACYEAAVGYDPFTPEVHALLACALNSVGAVDRAIDSLGKILFLDPLNWWAASQRARLYEQRGDMVEARRHWRRAQEGLAEDHQPFTRSLALGPLAEVAAGAEQARADCAAAMQRLTRR